MSQNTKISAIRKVLVEITEANNKIARNLVT